MRSHHRTNSNYIFMTLHNLKRYCCNFGNEDLNLYCNINRIFFGHKCDSAKKEKKPQECVSFKGMHLPEIFGLSTFPVFQHCQTFDGRKSSENYTYFRRSKLLRNRNYQNFLKLSTYVETFENRRFLSKISLKHFQKC